MAKKMLVLKSCCICRSEALICTSEKCLKMFRLSELGEKLCLKHFTSFAFSLEALIWMCDAKKCLFCTRKSKSTFLQQEAFKLQPIFFLLWLLLLKGNVKLQNIFITLADYLYILILYDDNTNKNTC